MISRDQIRTEKLVRQGLSYIMGELTMWGEKYSGGGSVPKSVKRRVNRLMNARKIYLERKQVKDSLPENELEKRIAEYENKDLTSTVQYGIIFI